VPAAAPLSRGPSVLTLYSAADLLTGPGCPVCRYAGEAGDRYLAWFALAAHAEAVTITRLCASLGMCPRHTRRLMGQPGANIRLTAVYRYVIEAARDRLTGRAVRLAACPACEHDDAAAGRALDTLLDGLADGSVRDRYRELGGLCVPHLRAAASARGRRRVVIWLAGTMMATLSARPPGLEWLAGQMDDDAEVRAVLRQAIPATVRPGSDVCMACLAAARAERDHLAQVSRAGGGLGQGTAGLLLCAGHLRDAAGLAGRGGVLSLLAWQADCHAASLSRMSAPPPRWTAGIPASWLQAARRRAASPDDCAVCQAREDAGRRAVDGFPEVLRGSPLAHDRRALLCVRHLLGLRAADPWAGQVTARGAVERADVLIAELTEAFRKDTWAHRHEARGPEMTAWRRAAAFLDGSVFCGCPPRET
jgi:hypothetical protein